MPRGADPYQDFEHFIARFLAAVRCRRSAEDYAEITCSPSTARVFGGETAALTAEPS